jgi:hypothetical protein
LYHELIGNGRVDNWQSHGTTPIVASHQIILPKEHSAVMAAIKLARYLFNRMIVLSLLFHQGENIPC